MAFELRQSARDGALGYLFDVEQREAEGQTRSIPPGPAAIAHNTSQARDD
jgi:hypothetical protein